MLHYIPMFARALLYENARPTVKNPPRGEGYSARGRFQLAIFLLFGKQLAADGNVVRRVFVEYDGNRLFRDSRYPVQLVGERFGNLFFLFDVLAQNLYRDYGHGNISFPYFLAYAGVRVFYKYETVLSTWRGFCGRGSARIFIKLLPKMFLFALILLAKYNRRDSADA